MEEYFKIGKLAATHGLGGQFILQHHLGNKSALKGLETIFIEEKKDSFLPYFISSLSARNDRELYLSLEGVASKEKAQLLLKKEVWLSEKDFKKYAAGAAPISFLGFTVINVTQPLGEVVEVIEQPHQILCTLILEGKEVLVPIHQHTLIKVDRINRKLYVKLPDGLLDIYQEG